MRLKQRGLPINLFLMVHGGMIDVFSVIRKLYLLHCIDGVLSFPLQVEEVSRRYILSQVSTIVVL